jgi:hypothetical protein
LHIQRRILFLLHYRERLPGFRMARAGGNGVLAISSRAHFWVIIRWHVVFSYHNITPKFHYLHCHILKLSACHRLQRFFLMSTGTFKAIWVVYLLHRPDPSRKAGYGKPRGLRNGCPHRCLRPLIRMPTAVCHLLQPP